VASAPTGVYLAFDGGPDMSAPGGPGIGPFDEIVLRGARAIGERAGLGRVIALRSAAGSWRDAETSSSESDQIDAGSGDLRVSAGEETVLARFGDDEVAGQVVVPDLGPFSVIVVGTHELRGDDQTLAVRVSRISPWQLTDRAGASFLGATKDAVAFLASGRVTGVPPRPWVVTQQTPAPPRAPAEDSAPSVWVDRVKPASEIYVSRPDRKR
jgi:hypothetical protein